MLRDDDQRGLRRDSEKAGAAARAVELVRDGMAIGLGTGSTIAHVIRLLGERVARGLRIEAIPTSRSTELLARSVGISLTTFARTPRLDLTIDGADEIDPKLRLTKGRGGALLHEKIVAAASDRVVIVADASKLVPVLRGPVPIEAIPFGFENLALKLKAIGGAPRLRLDDAGKAYVTDEGNWILDTGFGEIRDPEKLGRELDGLIGLVEHGLFVGMAQTAFVGEGSEVRILSVENIESSWD